MKAYTWSKAIGIALALAVAGFAVGTGGTAAAQTPGMNCEGANNFECPIGLEVTVPQLPSILACPGCKLRITGRPCTSGTPSQSIPVFRLPIRHIVPDVVLVDPDGDGNYTWESECDEHIFSPGETIAAFDANGGMDWLCVEWVTCD